MLRVADDGIGIEPEVKNRIFDSFYRAASSHAEGGGLGLAIVKWAAGMHQATIHISTGLDNTGSSFEVEFHPQG